MKRKYLYFILALVTIFAISSNASASKNISEYRILLGTEELRSEETAEEVNCSLQNLLMDKTQLETGTDIEFLIVFDEYLSPEFVQNVFKDVTINYVYYWVPGETGRTIGEVKNNDILGQIKENIADIYNSQTLEARTNAEGAIAPVSDAVLAIADQYEKGNIGVFALNITCNTVEAKNILEQTYVKALEPHYVEKYEETGIPVIYIDVPDKPDYENGVY